MGQTYNGAYSLLFYRHRTKKGMCTLSKQNGGGIECLWHSVFLPFFSLFSLLSWPPQIDNLCVCVWRCQVVVCCRFGRCFRFTACLGHNSNVHSLPLSSLIELRFVPSLNAKFGGQFVVDFEFLLHKTGAAFVINNFTLHILTSLLWIELLPRLQLKLARSCCFSMTWLELWRLMSRI